MSEVKLYQLALSLAEGVGDLNARQLVSYCGSPDAVFKSSKTKLLKIPGIGQKVVNSILDKDLFTKAEEELENCEAAGIDFCFFTDKDFPKRLKVIRDAPSLLFYKGSCDLNFKRSVAIVGTRKATPYGQEVTATIVSELKKYDPVIISGLAYGIDVAAHRSALKHGLQTAAIVASGLDIVYPAAHRSVAREILDQGVMVSENKLGVLPDAHFFPARNRIIAGMADVVIVVEAASKGGALITANIANAYNKDVLAVPGDIGNPYSTGCNQLIRDNLAHIYTGVQDIEMMTNWDQALDGFDDSDVEDLNIEGLSEEEMSVIRLLTATKEGVLFDDIAWKCQLSVNQVASMLLGLEFKGLISTLPGKRYKMRVGAKMGV